MKAYKIKKKTAERLLAVMNRQKDIVIQHGYFTITNEESEKCRNVKSTEIYERENSLGFFEAVLSFGNYGDLDSKDIIAVQEIYQKLITDKVFKPSKDLDWFNRKLFKMIKAWES